jgi:hypothetical protein
VLLRGNWQRKTFTLEHNPPQTIKIRRFLNKTITDTGLSSPSTWIPMLVFPLFMLISKQARHGWAHEHEQRSVEGCYIVFNWCINLTKTKPNCDQVDIQTISNRVPQLHCTQRNHLENELQRLATETAAAGLPRRQVHGVQPRLNKPTQPSHQHCDCTKKEN